MAETELVAAICNQIGI